MTVAVSAENCTRCGRSRRKTSLASLTRSLGGRASTTLVEWFFQQFHTLAVLVTADADSQLRGLFVAGDENGVRQWQVQDRQVLIVPADTHHAYLY